MAERTVFGNNFSIYIEAVNKEEADRLFAGLSADGQVMMPMSVAHWGDYFGMFTDKFGVNWLLNCARQHMG
ncbi:VOC family protein [Bacteroides oleiciplenus]|nr:VOC family protein [Bacteroides oleiciplenus]